MFKVSFSNGQIELETKDVAFKFVREVINKIKDPRVYNNLFMIIHLSARVSPSAYLFDYPDDDILEEACSIQLETRDLGILKKSFGYSENDVLRFVNIYRKACMTNTLKTLHSLMDTERQTRNRLDILNNVKVEDYSNKKLSKEEMTELVEDTKAFARTTETLTKQLSNIVSEKRKYIEMYNNEIDHEKESLLDVFNNEERGIS